MYDNSMRRNNYIHVVLDCKNTKKTPNKSEKKVKITLCHKNKKQIIYFPLFFVNLQSKSVATNSKIMIIVESRHS